MTKQEKLAMLGRDLTRFTQMSEPTKRIMRETGTMQKAFDKYDRLKKELEKNNG